MGQSTTCCCSESSSEYAVDEQMLYLAELDVLKLARIPMEHFQRKNVTFSFRDGNMVTVRTFIFSDQGLFQLQSDEALNTSKPTLLMIHGFGGSACLFYPILK